MVLPFFCGVGVGGGARSKKYYCPFRGDYTYLYQRYLVKFSSSFLKRQNLFRETDMKAYSVYYDMGKCFS